VTLVYLLAGEASGDVLGSRLMTSLRALRPDVDFVGVGGPMMEVQGLDSLFPIRDLAVMGLLEVLPRVRLLRRRLHQARDQIARLRPDVVVTIDSPGFALHLLRAIAPLGIRRVHYVAPQVWAWREHRVRSFPGLWDKLLCLLPFEPAYFARHGLSATFVGHPVLQSGADHGDAQRFRATHDLPPEARLIVLMPGSRRSEAPRLLPVFGRMLERLAPSIRGLTPFIPVSPAVADTVRAAAAGWKVRPLVVTDLQDKHDGYAAAEAALTKSGTSTLELALAGVPMAVTYRVNPLSAAMARRMIRVKHVAMVNLLAGRQVVPELLQQDCTPEQLAATLRLLMTSAAEANAQRDAFASVLSGLRPPRGLPSDAAAREVLDLIEQA
jgi:lipid-A-disaccharide synthase